MGQFRGRQGDFLRFTGRQGDRELVKGVVDDGVRIDEAQEQSAFDRQVLLVPQRHADREVGRFEVFHVKLGHNVDVLDGEGARGVQSNGTDDAHAFIQGAGVPVHVTVVQIPLLRAAELDFQHVLAFQQLRHVEGAADERTVGGVRRRDLLPVQEDVGVIVQAVEDKL